MKFKKCFKCGIEKDLSEFYKHPQMSDGHFNKCKECTKKDVSENYFKRHDYYKLYDRLRLDNSERAEARNKYSTWLRKNDPERYKRYHDKYDENKKKASEKVNNAVRDNRLEKLPCCICGNTKSEGHHEDYNNPLQVIWLCKKHHGMIHRTTEKGIPVFETVEELIEYERLNR